VLVHSLTANSFGLSTVARLVSFSSLNFTTKVHNEGIPTEVIPSICTYLYSTVNKRADNGTTPVYFASQEGRLDCLQFLVTQANANPRLRANDGMAPIHAAAQMGQLDCLAWLVIYNY